MVLQKVWGGGGQGYSGPHTFVSGGGPPPLVPTSLISRMLATCHLDICNVYLYLNYINSAKKTNGFRFVDSMVYKFYFLSKK